MKRTLYGFTICLLFSFAIPQAHGQMTVSSPASGSVVGQCGKYIIHFSPGSGFSGNATAEVHLNNSSGAIVQTVGYPSGTLSINYDNAFNASGLTIGNSYQIKVFDAYSPTHSALSGIFTVAASTPPTVINQTANSYTWIEINWPTVIGASAYSVDVATASDFSSGVVWSNHAASLSDPYGLYINSLTAGTTYYVRIKTSSSCGSSAYSGTYAFSTPTCTPPSVPTATAATNVKTAQFTANWGTVTGATSYDLITTYGSTHHTDNTTGTSFTFLQAHPASGYSYTVKARNACAVSTESNSITLTTNALGIPGHLGYHGTDEDLNIYWDAIDGASQYNVLMSTDSTFANVLFNETIPDHDDDVDVAPCLNYYFKVKAIAATGEQSAFSQRRWISPISCRIASDGSKDNQPITDQPIDWIKPFVFFPNPADNLLTVGLPSDFHFDNFNIKTLDATGREVVLPYQLSQTKATFDVSGINSGLYIMTFTDGIVKHRSKFLRK
ncbi:MAG: T9SS type A sorting domain-containing protein [Bacteroidota bacterium]